MDPRIERTVTAVMDACTALLLDEGPAALTMDAVVARSGVAKSTIYRHWPSRDDLLADFFGRCAPDIPEPGAELSFEDALRQQLDGVAEALCDGSWRRLLPALMLLERQQPQLTEAYLEVKRSQEDRLLRLLGRGVDAGQLDRRILDEPQVAMALLVGPLFMLAISGDQVPDDLVGRSIEQFLAGYRP